MSNEGPGFWRRLLTARGGALHRQILGKTSRESMKQFNGSNEYRSRAIAAKLGGPQMPAFQ